MHQQHQAYVLTAIQTKISVQNTKSLHKNFLQVHQSKQYHRQNNRSMSHFARYLLTTILPTMSYLRKSRHHTIHRCLYHYFPINEEKPSAHQIPCKKISEAMLTTSTSCHTSDVVQTKGEISIDKVYQQVCLNEATVSTDITTAAHNIQTDVSDTQYT